ncbi:MAG TPA: SusC/RagA family TonB-linked outer membrane protein [Chitinophagaceae bacterium]|nr:SusC/RagA family TonB-linked outer membrane protein [Chitinophagaceae bacterium]
MRKLLTLFTVLIGCCLLVHSQTRKISGKVLDEKGNPIPYATVKIKGKNAGTSADQNGNFEIQLSPKDVLTISSIGFDLQEVTVGNTGSVSVNLKGNKLMEEVIVTAQGIRRRPRELGYSAVKISNDDIMVGRSPQLAQSLSGKVSGLAIFNVNNSIDPSYKFTLRGYRSITGSNDALIVIDGMPFPPPSSTDPTSNTASTSPLSLLNPNDIDNISILKGGQAATLYGSDGVNGVIVITTKKGTKGKARVSYSNATNIEIVSFLPDFQDKFGSGSHYAASFGTAAWKPNYLDRMKDNWKSYENQQFGDTYDGSLRPVGRVLEDGSVFTLPYSAIPGERKRIWDKGFTTNNQVSLSGGNDQTTFFLSLENNYTKGIVPGDVSKRNGARFAGTTESGRLRAGYTLAYVQQDFDRSTFDFYNESLNQAAHIPLSTMRDWQHYKFASPNAYYNDYYTNPYFKLDNERTRYKDANISGNIELNYKVTSWLNIYEKFNLANNSRTRKNTVGQFFYSPWAKTKAYVPAPFGTTAGDGTGITRTGTDIPGSVYDASVTENRFNNELQVQLNKNFGGFSLRGLVGFSVNQNTNKIVEISSSSIVVPGVYNVSNRQGVLGGGESNNTYRKFGYYADVSVGWKDMIYLHGAGRYDFTSKFYKSYRPSDMYSYFYPGVDLSLVLTEMAPMLKNSVLSYAKLRAGINKNGNDNLGSASTLYGLDPSYTPPAGFPYNNTVGVTVGNTLPDSSLKPEKVISWEVGGEFQLFNNRISLDGAYYSQNSKGTVVDVTVPATTGYSVYRFNVGETKNWGYELDLKAQIIRGKKFTWDFNVRYSYNDNKVLQLYPGVDEFATGGYAYASTYIIKDNPFPVLKAIGYVRDPATGRVIVNKTNGYPLNNGPLTNFGRTTPKYTLGVGTRLAYSDFTLTTNFEYRGGNKIYSDLGRQMTFTGSGKWTEDRAPHIFPNSAYDDGTGKYVANTTVNTAEAEYALWDTYYKVIAENFVTPGWFIKMRDINLAYNLPASLLGKTKFLGAASIALYGRNLITIVDKSNFYTDPEFSFTTGNGQGINNTSQTPPVRQYGFNINLTFK